jgi:hypothetical protein
MHVEWRVVNPAMTMAYLIILIWAVLQAREAPTCWRIAWAGASFGLLFYVYFHYWTAVGLALVLALGLDAGHRATYFHTGWIGGLLGLPALLSSFLMKERMAPDWFFRQELFLPIDRFSDLVLPKEVLTLAILGLALVLLRRGDLLFVWALGLAGLMLANNQIVTGLQIGNYHWMYVWGPVFCFLFMVVTAEALGNHWNWSPGLCAVFAAVGLTAYGTGMWIRTLEATRCDEPIHNAAVIVAYRAELPCERATAFIANSVVAGADDFVAFASILDNLRPLCDCMAFMSYSMSDAELDKREALNDLLLGFDRPAFESRQRAYFERFGIGPWKRNRSLIPVRVAGRLAAYDVVHADLPAALDYFAVRYVALPAGKRPNYLARDWACRIAGPTWDVWERSPFPEATPRATP